MTDFAGWPSWNPQITAITVEGALEPGTRFRWRSGPGTITSLLRAVDPPHELGWSGKTLGIKAVHVWRLQAIAGGTRVTTEESWRGWPARLLRTRMTRTLEDAIRTGLASLKAESERRAALTRTA